MPLFHVKLEKPADGRSRNIASIHTPKIEAQHLRLREVVVEHQPPDLKTQLIDGTKRNMNGMSKLTLQSLDGSARDVEVYDGSTLKYTVSVAAGASTTIYKQPGWTLKAKNSGDIDKVMAFHDGVYTHSAYLLDLSKIVATTSREVCSNSTYGQPGTHPRAAHSELVVPINATGKTDLSMDFNVGFDSATLTGEWEVNVVKDEDQRRAPSWGTEPGNLTAIHLYFEYETNDHQS